jgi:hypothetical protein
MKIELTIESLSSRILLGGVIIVVVAASSNTMPVGIAGTVYFHDDEE